LFAARSLQYEGFTTPSGKLTHFIEPTCSALLAASIDIAAKETRTHWEPHAPWQQHLVWITFGTATTNAASIAAATAAAAAAASNECMEERELGK